MGRLHRLARRVVHLAGGARWGLIAGGVSLLVLVAVLLAVIVYLPPLAIDPRGLTQDEWLTHVQDLRTTILQGLDGLVVLLGAIVAALNLRETSRQNRAAQMQSREVIELQGRGQITERFTRAIEQLGQQGPEKLDVRIGAIYALEQIARDSAELHWPIMEVLTAYLREHARVPSLPRPAVDAEADALPPRWGEHPPADVQAIATVIGRRQCWLDPSDQRLDLREVDLRYVRWANARLEGGNLTNAHLQQADLVGAQLQEAVLYRAQLRGADLRQANLKGVSLQEAQLSRASLIEADLQGADLRHARLNRAWLANARLQTARLYQAHLQKANLNEAQLQDVDLVEAQLQDADLVRAQLQGANLFGTFWKGANLFRADLSTARHLWWPGLEVGEALEHTKLPADMQATLARAIESGRPPHSEVVDARGQRYPDD